MVGAQRPLKYLRSQPEVILSGWTLLDELVASLERWELCPVWGFWEAWANLELVSKEL